MSSTWASRTVVVGGLACLLVAGATLPAQGAKDRAVRGDLAALPGAAAHVPHISGRVQVVRTGAGHTKLTVHVKGLEPGETYGVHLHNAPCSAANPGGGHYMFDPHGAKQPPNELWASSDSKDPMAGITANPAGNAHGKGTALWTAGPEAKAVVVHTGFSHGGTAGGGAKVACADLR